MAQSESSTLIYAACNSNLLNWYISQGVTFEVHPFPYRDALVLVLKALTAQQEVSAKGDMRFVLIRSQDGEVSTYDGGSLYLKNYYTPETVAQDAATRFSLEDAE